MPPVSAITVFCRCSVLIPFTFTVSLRLPFVGCLFTVFCRLPPATLPTLRLRLRYTAVLRLPAVLRSYVLPCHRSDRYAFYRYRSCRLPLVTSCVADCHLTRSAACVFFTVPQRYRLPLPVGFSRLLDYPFGSVRRCDSAVYLLSLCYTTVCVATVCAVTVSTFLRLRIYLRYHCRRVYALLRCVLLITALQFTCGAFPPTFTFLRRLTFPLPHRFATLRTCTLHRYRCRYHSRHLLLPFPVLFAVWLYVITVSLFYRYYVFVPAQIFAFYHLLRFYLLRLVPLPHVAVYVLPLFILFCVSAFSLILPAAVRFYRCYTCHQLPTV